MKWREQFSNMALKSLVDVDELGYEIHPSISYDRSSRSKQIRWYSMYKGKRLCVNTTKFYAKRVANLHLTCKNITSSFNSLIDDKNA